MRQVRWVALGCLATVGCLGPDKPGFFGRPAPAGPLPNVAPASTEAAARVDAIGRCILTANRQAGVDTRTLLFHTIGAPQPEIFHRGTNEIIITEGLVRQCASDGQLAAVLCTELGRLVSERETFAPADVRRPERLPPIDTGLNRDAGWGTAADQTRVRELADYDRERRQQRTPLAPPDPQALARVYLVRAGYHDDDMAAAAALLQAARANGGFEKQMTAGIDAPR